MNKNYAFKVSQYVIYFLATIGFVANFFLLKNIDFKIEHNFATTVTYFAMALILVPTGYLFTRKIIAKVSLAGWKLWLLILLNFILIQMQVGVSLQPIIFGDDPSFSLLIFAAVLATWTYANRSLQPS